MAEGIRGAEAVFRVASLAAGLSGGEGFAVELTHSEAMEDRDDEFHSWESIRLLVICQVWLGVSWRGRLWLLAGS